MTINVIWSPMYNIQCVDFLVSSMENKLRKYSRFNKLDTLVKNYIKE